MNGRDMHVNRGCDLGKGNVGDTESGPKSDILGQASARIRTDHCLDFPA